MVSDAAWKSLLASLTDKYGVDPIDAWRKGGGGPVGRTLVTLVAGSRAPPCSVCR